MKTQGIWLWWPTFYNYPTKYLQRSRLTEFSFVISEQQSTTFKQNIYKGPDPQTFHISYQNNLLQLPNKISTKVQTHNLLRYHIKTSFFIFPPNCLPRSSPQSIHIVYHTLALLTERRLRKRHIFKGEQGSKSILDLCVYWENTSNF